MAVSAAAAAAAAALQTRAVSSLGGRQPLVISHFGSPSVLRLSRELLRAAKSFKNLNFRDYFVRRTKEKIRELSSNKEADLENVLKKELSNLQRQALVANIYHTPTIVVYK